MDGETDGSLDEPGPSNQRNNRRIKTAHANNVPNRGNHFANNIKRRPTMGNEGPKYRQSGIHTRGRTRFNASSKYYDRQSVTSVFKTLEELSECDTGEIIQMIHGKKDSFTRILEAPIRNPDVFVLIMKILAKICDTSFDQHKLKLLLNVCNSQFINNLRVYLMDLPDSNQRLNSLYWQNQSEFWMHLISFCECIVLMSPSTALLKCRNLIQSTTTTSLQGLNLIHKYELPDIYAGKLKHLIDSLTKCEEKDEDKKRTLPITVPEHNDQPPDDFRQLSILPTPEDFFARQPFLRPNIINGAYQSVEHYLDVQFRLLREDCLGPVRDGIQQYRANPTKTRFDNIRVYRNVKFFAPYIDQMKVGCQVQVDENARKKFKKINWAHTSRFMFGSLLIFTNDNLNTIIVATVLDQNPKYLSQGKIPVSIVDLNIVDDLYKNDANYVMIESDVYFEPYIHVLKALQDPEFGANFCMAQYIVHVDATPKPPAYLEETSTYELKTEQDFCIDSVREFNVLDFTTWPSSEDLNLDKSQYEAYKLALTHEFAVIQGPPGTGKTHIGVKVAKTLLENVKPSNKNKCLMLLICYTNHALDQFLEAMLPVTKSIVRIGNRSRNEALEKYNLNNKRNALLKSGVDTDNRIFFEAKNSLKNLLNMFHRIQKAIETLNNGVLSYKFLNKHVEACQTIGHHRKYIRRGDPLVAWLFENMTLVNEIDEDIFAVSGQDGEKVVNDKRGTVHLDDIEFDDILPEFNLAFSVTNTITELKKLLTYYKGNEFQSYDERENVHYNILNLNSQLHFFNEMSSYRYMAKPYSLACDPSTISTVDRWKIYYGWLDVVVNEMKKNLQTLKIDLHNATEVYEESRMMLDLLLLKNNKIIGMTTSGAARLRKLLKALAPPIVIVEEAAEVLEQHIITSLTKDCSHLILIGDHQQLRPSASHMKLAKHFNIEVSLFERMIMNNIHSRRLAVQHRMRPEIAAMISPHIYEDLLNHPTVERFPDVKGMNNNLFFFTHDYKEDHLTESTSRSNRMEADLTLHLANYTMQQGYEPEDVTILAAYAEQMFYMRKQRQKYAFLSKVKITVVDNYQGEESRIILLSLVRNNDEEKIGFLGTANRICVALSRAKEGFYIFGNIDLLKKKSELWSKIAKSLEENGSLGTTLKLKCQNHENQITDINVEKDFENVPEGGCLLPCGRNLNCGHQCPLACHGYDKGHSMIKCIRKCERIICDLLHVCPLDCCEKCKQCVRPVPKTLTCGHVMTIPCHLDPTNPSVKCKTVVTVKLLACGHETMKPCHLNIMKVCCPIPCISRVEKCGHACTLTCHVNNDPNHEKYVCKKLCAKAKSGCTANLMGDRGEHQCMKQCYEACDSCQVQVPKKRSNCRHTKTVACNEDVDDTPCTSKCARSLPCGHFCKKKCFEKCGDCNAQVTKIIPDCGHEIKIECQKIASRDLCKRKCELLLSCGHRCPGRCDEPCEVTKCTETIPQKIASPCGHMVSLPCNDFQSTKTGTLKKEVLVRACTEPCGVTLACGHECGGTCGACRAGRLHQACTQPCHQTLICGHRCEYPCNQTCPPCGKPCEVKCKHSNCDKPCGALCVPCQEPCSRSCSHGKCSRRCGEECSWAACAAPCPRRLPCAHPCRGLCGEPCPDICRLCRPDTFPTDFLGYDFEDEDRFIRLEDCNHIMEIQDMDNLMFGDKETVSIRTCPFCRKPIINTPRYKNVINNIMKNEINPIKERVYGSHAERQTKKNNLMSKVATYVKTHPIYKEIILSIDKEKTWKKALLKVFYLLKSKQNLSLLELEMIAIYLEILGILSDTYNKYNEMNTTMFQEELFGEIVMICCILINNKQKISEQQQKDIGNELKRINAIVQFSKICSNHAYTTLKGTPEVLKAFDSAEKVVFGWTVFDEENTLKRLKDLQKTVNLSNVITKQERDLIVKAIGLKAGHWYKCPNGHFYCIGECGGAMEMSKCNECGAQIGGSRHNLLQSNSHAPEMDGSKFPAWSEQYNNMANFNLH